MRPAASSLIAPIAVIALATACRLPERNDLSTRVEERTLELKPGGQFHAVTFNGSIDLEGWERDEVQLVAKIRERREGEVRFTAESKDGLVTVRAERETAREADRIFRFGESSGASLTVKIPRKAVTTLYSSNGRLEIKRVDSEIDANTSNGSIVAVEIGAKASLTTSNGSISASRIKGGLFARTSNGSVNAADVAGDADIRSSNGRIDARRVNGKTDATTSNASIVTEELGADARLTTSNGSITAASIKGEAFARTTNGRIDVSDVTGEADLRTSNGTIRAVNVKGKTGAYTSSGSIIADRLGSDLVVRSTNGRIEISSVLGSIDAETSNASITATDLDGKGGGIRLATSNGSINVNLGRAQGTVQAKASDGKAISIDAPDTKLLTEAGSSSAKSAKIGNSDQLIDLRTTHGRITVR